MMIVLVPTAVHPSKKDYGNAGPLQEYYQERSLLEREQYGRIQSPCSGIGNRWGQTIAAFKINLVPGDCKVCGKMRFREQIIDFVIRR